jgi:adenylate cyclase
VELQQKAAELRKNRRRNREADNASESGKEPDEITPIREEAESIEIDKNEVIPTPQDAEVPATEEDDYLQQLQKRGRRLRKNDEDSKE